MEKETSDFTKEYHFLAELFLKCKYFKADDAHQAQAWELADGLLDIEKHSKKYLNELLPKLRDANLSEEDRMVLLAEIGQEFLFILYKLKRSEFYKNEWEYAGVLPVRSGKKEEKKL